MMDVMYWVFWLAPAILVYVVSGFAAVRDVKNNHALFTFLKQNALNMQDFVKELTQGREDLVADNEDLQTLSKNNKEILVACEKIYELDKKYIHRLWMDPITEIRYVMARRRILKEAM
jgi:hypothetical protein